MVDSFWKVATNARSNTALRIHTNNKPKETANQQSNETNTDEQQNQVQQNISKRKTLMAIPNWINDTHTHTQQKHRTKKPQPKNVAYKNDILINKIWSTIHGKDSW